jgi:MOSC domain-containing protein YiiM
MKNKKVIRKSVNNRQSGKVVSINVSKEKGVKKEPVTEAFIGVHGIAGDGHSGQWHRQISILSFESMEEINKKGIIEVSPGDFAENIATKGLNLKDLKIGDIIVFENAKKVVLEVTQIGKECHNPCRIFYEMGSCIMPAEGIFCKVINTGKIKVGDNIHILNK